MTEAALPPHEAERLTALYGYEILDTPPEKPLDDLVQLAAYICQAPVALISLIDSDRPWFKSKVDLTETQTAQIIAFCAHTILGTDLLVVPDALADERFSTNPLVTGEPHIRFYCGAPLTTPEGHRIGMLSVIDRVPRELSEEQFKAMRGLSRQVMDHLMLDRRHRELVAAVKEQRQAERLSQASMAAMRRHALLLNQSHEPAFAWELDGPIVHWNRGAERLYGIPAQDAVGRLPHDLLHTRFPDSLDACRKALERTGLWEGELQQQLRDGSTVIVDSRMTVMEENNSRLVLEANRDITARKQAEELFRVVVESAPNGLLIVNQDGIISLVNAQIEQQFGYDREGLLGQPIEILLPERYRAQHPGQRGAFFNNLSTRAMGAGRELYGRRKDGVEFPVEIGLNPIETPEGMHVLASVIDITARKQAEHALWASEERMKAILDNSPLLVFIKDRDGRYVLTNREFDQRFGLPTGHAIGKTDSDLFLPEQAAAFRANDQKVFQTGEPIQLEEVWYFDRQYTGLVVKFPFFGPLKEVHAIGGIVMDITERKVAEESLRESEERFRLVAEVTNDVLWDWDLVTDEYWWSPNARGMFGYDPSLEPTIKAWSARLHPDERQRVLRDVDETIKSGNRAYVGECRFRLADGSYGFFVNKGQIVHDTQGRPVRMIGAMVDVTSAKQAYRSLTIAYERLQDMGRDLQMAEENERRRLSRELHDEFGQILSALKLQIARAADQLLHRRNLSESMLKKHIANAGKAVDQLFASLREMIHGLRPAILEELGLVAALQEQAGEMREAGIQCRVSADRDDYGSLLGVELEGALYRIGQELLTNVLRHAKATVATLTLTSVDGRVTLTVRDNGRGFPAGFTLPKDRFGLMGVRERVELLGGQLDVQSKSGRGAVVTVDFPIASTMREQGSSDSSGFVVRATGKKRRHHGK